MRVGADIVRSPDDHLSVEEIDGLIAEHGAVNASHSPDHPLDSDAVADHVRRCEYCASALRKQARVQTFLQDLSKTYPDESITECPRPHDWARLFEEPIDESDVSSLVSHSANCPRCGFLLSVLYDSATSTDVSLEPKTGGRTPSEIAEEMARRSAPNRLSKSSHSWVLGAAAAAIATYGVSLFLWRTFSDDDIDALLRIAYAKERTLELRFDGAPHAPLRVVRDTTRASDRPDEYLEAQARILKDLRVNPAETALLHANARLSLLAWDFDQAIVVLERLHETNPSSDVSIDLATAYYQRAQSAERPVDNGRALELLNRVVEQDPDNLVALFNRAVVLEKLQLFRQAAAAWNRYLQFDGNGEWANEARERRDVAVARINDRGSVPGRPDGLYRADGHLPEELLQRAVTDWLPKLWNSTTSEAEFARRRLGHLASRMLKDQRDPWLRDLLYSSSESWFASAANTLLSAIEANARADSDEAYSKALLAAEIFHHHGARAGVARATYEALYALQRNSFGEQCLGLLTRFEALATGRYPWLEIQGSLDEASCSNMTGDLTRARRAAERALALAEQAGYSLLQLRAAGILATQYTAMGNVHESWTLDQAGLREFWRGRYPAVRAYQFYDDFSMGAERLGLSHVARDAAAEATEFIALTGNPLWEAAARAKSARIALLLNDVHHAGSEYDAASNLFGLAPPSRSRRVNQIYSEIGLALVEAKQGHARTALSRLEEMRDELEAISNQIVEEEYYLAELEGWEALGDTSQIESSLREVVRLASHRLESIEPATNRYGLARDASKLFRRLVNVHLDRDQDEAAFELWLQYKKSTVGSSSSAAFAESDNRRVAHSTYGGILPSVAENETRLVYVVLPNRLQIWLYDRERYSSARVAISEPSLNMLVRAYVRLCSNPESDLNEILAAGKRLYRVLLEPVESELDSGQRLVIQPDGALVDVPFDALFALHGEDRFVGGVVLSLGGEAHPLPAVSPRRERLLTVNAPTLSPETVSRIGSLTPLSDTRREGELAASVFPEFTVLSGRDATSENLELALMNASIVHFAGHAIMRAEQSYLVLSGPLREALWTPLLLPSRRFEHWNLIVLSACSTDQPAEARLGSPGPLVTGFLDAGAKQVVATRWRVDSAITADLLGSFFTQLAVNGDASSALNHAIQSTRERQQHPYYWAGFVLYVT